MKIALRKKERPKDGKKEIDKIYANCCFYLQNSTKQQIKLLKQPSKAQFKIWKILLEIFCRVLFPQSNKKEQMTWRKSLL